MLRATRPPRAVPSGAPVLKLMSYFGKFEEEISSRKRCPFLNRFTVANGVMVISNALHRGQQGRAVEPVAVAHPENPVGQDHRIAARIIGGGRVDIHEFRGEIGIRRIGRDAQPHRNRPPR